MRLTLFFCRLACAGLAGMAGMQPLSSGEPAPAMVAGPVVGAVSMYEARVWVQLDRQAALQLLYWPAGREAEEQLSERVTAGPAPFPDAVLVATGLRPGTDYEYAVLADGEPLLVPHRLRWRTPPLFRDRAPPPDVRFAVLSGHRAEDERVDPPYLAPPGSAALYAGVLAQRPEFLVWAGHTFTGRAHDFSGPAALRRRLAQSRSGPEFVALHAATAGFATWSGAEFGPFAAVAAQRPEFPWVREQFARAWPDAGAPQAFPSPAPLLRAWSWADADFFLLDALSAHRPRLEGADSPEARFGRRQWERLFRLLGGSQATFKFVISGTPVLQTAESPPNLRAYPAEWDSFRELLRRNPVDGLVFLVGGRGQGELTRFVRPEGYAVFELAVGPATAAMATGEQRQPPPENYFRVPGATVAAPHYALVHIQGPEHDRELQLVAYNADNLPLWERIIPAAALVLDVDARSGDR